MAKVIIIGAGASFDHSGGVMPVTSHLVETILRRSRVKSQSTSQQLQLAALRRLLEVVYGIAVDDSNILKIGKKVNIEDLLTLGQIEQEVSQSAINVLSVIQLINRTIIDCQSEVSIQDGAYKHLVSEVLAAEDSIITFNWDTLLDQELEGFTRPNDPYADKGPFLEYIKLCTAEWENTWDGTSIRRPYGSEGYEKALQGATQRAYIKLHGSVDVVACKNQRCRNANKPLRAGPWTPGLRCGECFEAVQPYVIPPLQNKPLRDNLYIRRSWTRARELVSEADAIYVWGDGLPPTDYWANWLIQTAWRSKCRRIVIINPDVVYSKSGNLSKKFIYRFLSPQRGASHSIAVEVCRSFSDLLANRLITVN